MILENAVPILAIAMDKVPDFYNQHIGAISQAMGEVTQAEGGWLDAALDRFVTSDVAQKQRRLFIPIDDALYPIHYTGGQMSKRNDATVQKLTTANGTSTIEANVMPGSNTVSLSFEIKSSVSSLSAVADLLHALASSHALSSGDVSRISFFSSTMCIFNAKFLGLSRATVTNSQKEMVTLNLEVSEGLQERVTNKGDTQPTEPKLIPNVGAGGRAAEGAAAQATAADFNPAYDFYLIAAPGYLESRDVPDTDSERTVQRQDYRLFRVKSVDHNRLARDMVGVQFAGEHISLEASEPFRYEGALGLVRYFDSIYLGVLRAG